jgi:hypothetical protein
MSLELYRATGGSWPIYTLRREARLEERSRWVVQHHQPQDKLTKPEEYEEVKWLTPELVHTNRPVLI